jgi:hypothetical protein
MRDVPPGRQNWPWSYLTYQRGARLITGQDIQVSVFRSALHRAGTAFKLCLHGHGHGGVAQGIGQALREHCA